MRGESHIAAACAALMLANGCSLAASYETEPEGSAEGTCSDGVDNDVDGVIDCADPDCFGPLTCDEDTTRTLGYCSDGHDNDLDGLIDDFDPACWSVAPRTVRRCGTIRGSEADLSPVDWTGGRFVEEPSGLTLQLDASTDALASARLARLLTGARKGTQVEASLSVPEGAEVELRLSPVESEHPIRSGVYFGVTRRGDPQLYLRVGENEDRWSLETADDRVDLRLSMEEGDVALCGSGPCVRVEPEFPLGLAPTFELSVAVTAGEAQIGEIAVSRPPHHPCIHPVPYDDERSAGTVHSVAVSGSRYCILFEEESGEMVSLHADAPEGGTFATTEPPAPDLRGSRSVWNVATADGTTLSGPVIDWDPDSGTFRGAAVVERGEEVTGEVALLESPDCDTWSAIGEPVAEHSFAFDDRPGGVLGYDVDDAGTHHLFTMRAERFAGEMQDRVVIRWESPSGGSRSFEHAQEDIINASTAQRHPYYRIQRIRGHRLVLKPLEGSSGGAIVSVADSGRVPLLEPSGIRGTFDTLWIEQGTLWMPEPTPGETWWGQFVYTARECGDCPPRLGFANFSPAFTQTFPGP